MEVESRPLSFLYLFLLILFFFFFLSSFCREGAVLFYIYACGPAPTNLESCFPPFAIRLCLRIDNDVIIDGFC